MNDDIHAPRLFKALGVKQVFRTGSADLTVWIKEDSNCARPLQNGQGRSRRFSPAQMVYVIKDGQRA